MPSLKTRYWPPMKIGKSWVDIFVVLDPKDRVHQKEPACMESTAACLYAPRSPQMSRQPLQLAGRAPPPTPLSAASLAIQKQYRTAGAKSARKTKRVEPNMWFRPTARARTCYAEYHAGHGRRACHTDKRLPRRMPCLQHWIPRLPRGI